MRRALALKAKSDGGGKCADFHMGHNNMYMGDCHGGDNQLFYFETWPPPSRLKSKWAADQCLDYSQAGDENLFFHPCHGGDNQLFYFKEGDAAAVPYDVAVRRYIHTYTHRYI